MIAGNGTRTVHHRDASGVKAGGKRPTRYDSRKALKPPTATATASLPSPRPLSNTKIQIAEPLSAPQPQPDRPRYHARVEAEQQMPPPKQRQVAALAHDHRDRIGDRRAPVPGSFRLPRIASSVLFSTAGPRQSAS